MEDIRLEFSDNNSGRRSIVEFCTIHIEGRHVLKKSNKYKFPLIHTET